MGGNSSSRHVSLDSDDEVTFVKGIRLSEKVIDRMKVSPPVVRPQAPTRSLMQPPTTPPVESSVPDERHVPIMPHSPSYASALVPPPFLEPITPLVPPVTEETSTPPSSEGLPIAAPSGNEHVVVPDAKPGSANILVPDPQPAEPINAPSRVSSETITAPPLVEPTCAPVEPLTPPPVTTSTTEPVTVPPSPTIDPPTEPVTSSVEPLTPPPVTTSTTESVTVPPSATSDPLTEPVKSSVELVVVPTEPIESVETPSSSTLAAEATSADPMDLPVPSPVELWTSPFPISIPNPVPSVMEESPVSSSGSSSDVALPDEMPEMGPPSTEKPLVPRLPPDEEPVVPSSIDPVEVFPPQTHAVNEEKLRVEIREDLQKLLNEEMKMAERNMRQQLEEETAKAKAQAQAAARLQIQEEVHKVLEEEKASYQQTLADAIRREQLNIQDEHLITQYYWMERKAQKLDDKEKDLQNQDALFQEQITKMQEKTAQLTKVMAENHRKGLEDATNRFRRYQIKPVCLDLQSQIMKCYAENKGQTMSCSNIASLYIQCVDRAKQDKKLSTGG